ncbi:hypothetical protein ACFZBP_07440 [Streptomyces sp. NPDC008086]|uniref:hypothetical protein n=1 Tax=Streptomyces sp. NPDC008086 TaxID=3364807 RepID=UPI0036E068D0
MPRTPLFVLHILDGRHEMTVTRLKRADDAFTLHYTITPPLPDSGSEPPLVPVLEARDDLGNTYDDRGGAYGTAPDGSHTDGSLTAYPALAPDAHTLRARVIFIQGGQEAAYDMTLGIRR